MRMYCNKQQPTISGDMNDMHFSYYFSNKSTKTFFLLMIEYAYMYKL